MSNAHAASAADARRAHVEALLCSYPDVTPQERDLLVNWFRNDASALDVALVASNADAHSGYRKFRSEHIDRFTLKDLVRALAFVAAIAIATLLIAWRAL